MELAKYDSFESCEISSIVDIKELLSKLKQIDALKVALDSVDRFHENAIRYARLEAAALIRVCELNGTNELKGFRRKVAEWLYGLDIAQRELYIEKCEDGLTIDQVWKQEIYNEEKLTKNVEHINLLREAYVDAVKEEGIVTIKSFVNEAKKVLPEKLANDVTDGLRNDLRKAGAVGIYDNDGTYVYPPKATNDDVKKAILGRFNSAAADFANLQRIACISKIKIEYEDFDVDIYRADRSNKTYLLHFLIALDRIGVISNADKMWSDFGKSEVYAEIKQIQDLTKKTMVEAARIVLRSYEVAEAKGA